MFKMYMAISFLSVVASLSLSVLSVRRGSPAGTRMTLHKSPFMTIEYMKFYMLMI